MDNRKIECSALAFFIAVVVVVVGGAVGYALNLWQIAGALGDVFTGVVLLRVIGVFFMPLGAILGWF